MSVATYTKTGNKATTAAKLSKVVFDVSIENHELIKSAYISYLRNGRQNLAVTKTRGLIQGGGRKPWRQKGTGRARVGSSRSPIWRGGGIVFGPTGIENYSHKLPLAQKRQALRQALSFAVHDNKLIVIEDLVIKPVKSQTLFKLLQKIGATEQSLLVVASKSPELVRVSRNLAHIKLVQVQYLTVFDIMNANTIVCTAEALAHVESWLGGSSK